MSYVASRKTLVVANHLIQPIASYILYNIATVTIAVMLFQHFILLITIMGKISDTTHGSRVHNNT